MVGVAQLCNDVAGTSGTGTRIFFRGLRIAWSSSLRQRGANGRGQTEAHDENRTQSSCEQSAKGTWPCEHFVNQHAESVDVGRRGSLAALHDLRGDVPKRSKNRARSSQPLRTESRNTVGLAGIPNRSVPAPRGLVYSRLHRIRKRIREMLALSSKKAIPKSTIFTSRWPALYVNSRTLEGFRSR